MRLAAFWKNLVCSGMFLKRLELQGFKSFADKTVLDFSSGIAAVVGPNGSGKSNITDAIRWLLGEREARNLRGGKVEDLIFAGTEKRPRLGLAQATLYFDNSSGFFPVEFKEVSISRRIGRDGKSEVLLNKSEVRLKDIIDFFAKSRMGHSGFTIVGQGDSDLFIRATPLERREMIEEILGLKEYQLKKAEAKRRLTNASINLDKASALLEELKPHLRLLKRQVSRYAEREELARELKELEGNFYGAKIKTLEDESAAVDPKIEALTKETNDRELAVKDAEEKLEAVKKSEPEANAEIQKIQSHKKIFLEKRAVFQKELGRIEAKLEIAATPNEIQSAELKRTLEEVKKLAAELFEERSAEALRNGIRRIVALIDKAFGENKLPDSAGINKEREKLLSDLKALDRESDELSRRESGLTKSLQEFNEDFRKAFVVLESERGKLSKLQSDKQRLLFEKERVDLQFGDLERQLSDIGRTLKDFSGWVGAAPENTDAATRRMFRLRSELAGIGEVDEALVKEAKETEERYNFLAQQSSDLEKAVADLRALTKELENKIHHDFLSAMKQINGEFTKLVRLMFGGGKASLYVQELVNNGNGAVAVESAALENEEIQPGVEVEITLPRKRIKGLEVLSGGERSLVSIAALFALISVSPPPFLVLDEVDAALDDRNAKRFGELLADFAKKTQFIIVTHNRATMEAADVLYGVTMSGDGTSKIVSLKLE